MPIYEYYCENCDYEFENINKFDDPNPNCELCGKESERMVSACGWHLNGDGWFNPHMPKKRARGGCPAARKKKGEK